MASIKIRHLDDRLMRALRVHAARHGRSMEEEARQILSTALDEEAAEPTNLFEAIRSRIAPLGGVHLDVPRRGTMRKPPGRRHKVGS
jgi:plasmid stability protein